MRVQGVLLLLNADGAAWHKGRSNNKRTKRATGARAAYLLLQRKRRQVEQSARRGERGASECRRGSDECRGEVWQVKGGMAGWKGEARFAPARCLRAAARPVGGGDAQTAGAVNSRIVECRK